MLSFVVTIAVFAFVVNAFVPKQAKFGPQTKLYERFNSDFKNPKIESDKLIFTEKQLREYTSTYSTDFRVNPLEAIFSIFKKGDPAPPAPVPVPAAKATSVKKASFSIAKPAPKAVAVAAKPASKAVAVAAKPAPKAVAVAAKPASKAVAVAAKPTPKAAAVAAKPAPKAVAITAKPAAAPKITPTKATSGSQNGKRKTVKIN